jgi:hypothetical protein
MEPLMSEENRIFLREMDAISNRGEKVDLAAWYRLWAWDMSGELAFGKGFQMMGNGGDKTGYIVMIDAGTQFGGVVSSMRMTRVYGWIGQMPSLMPIVTHPLLTSWQSKFQKLIAGKSSLIELTKQHVQECLGTQKTDRRDLVGRLVALRDDKNVTIDMDDIHTEAIEIVYVLFIR